MRYASLKNPYLFALGVVALMAVLFLAGCGGDDDREMEEMMMPAPVGYKVTVTNNLAEELFAPILVTHASNDTELFTDDNYVTPEAEEQILTGDPARVVARIGEGGAVVDHGLDPKPNDPTATVLLGPGKSVSIMFEQDATALRILSMVAPTMVPDNYVSAVADVADLMAGDSITVPLSRFDIGYDEMTMDNMRLMEISLVGENAGTVTIERLGESMADDGGMMGYPATYTVEVTNELSDELLAPIVVARVTDEHYLFTGDDVTEAAEHQILFGDPTMVVDAIGMDNVVVFHGDAGPPGVLLPAGESLPSEPFETGATALRIFAMVAPTMVPDNYVSAVVNVANLKSGDYVMAPLTRFDIGHDEAVPDHMAEMPDHHEMPQMVHRHGDMMSDIMQVDAGMTVGSVKITRE